MGMQAKAAAAFRVLITNRLTWVSTKYSAKSQGKPRDSTGHLAPFSRYQGGHGVTVQLIAAKFVSCEVVSRSDVAAQLLCDGARIDLVRYPYALIQPLQTKETNFPLAGLRDLGVMKFAAIARRGIRRDFWDLFEILNLGQDTLRTLASDYICNVWRSRERSLSCAQSAHVFR